MAARNLISKISHSSLFCASLLSNLLQTSLQILLIFLEQLWIARSGVNLARLVLPFVKLLFCPLIMNADLIGAVKNLSHQLRWNEIHAFAVANNHVTRHHGYATDAHRNIDACQHDIADGSWVGGPKIGGHVDLRNTVEVADASIDNQPAPVGRSHHIVKEVVANDGSVHLFAEN